MLRLVESVNDQANVTGPVEELLRRFMVGKSELTQKTYAADLEFWKIHGLPGGGGGRGPLAARRR